MKKYTVDEPEFNKTLIITETTDTGHADNINKAPKMAFENTLYLEKTKLDADGGDISEAVIKAADEIEDDEYPIPASGDKPRTFLGKTKKFLGNIKDWMTGVCLLGQIVNNCVTDNAKLPLSAAQGKALMDLYNVLNTKSQKRKHIVAIETATVALSPQLSNPNIKNGCLIAGKFIDLAASFPEHNSIVPIPFLIATGWFHGGVEIQTISKNSITVRLLNGTDKDSGGYASFKLLFFE